MVLQLGYVTVDNAANNDTMLKEIERRLRIRRIAFDAVNNRVR